MNRIKFVESGTIVSENDFIQIQLSLSTADIEQQIFFGGSFEIDS